ncbi:MAG: hypothetical protein JWP29_4839 [Rhodoferax sp.]|nr:hypothetical protein [Rhodoferax sp.]
MTTRIISNVVDFAKGAKKIKARRTARPFQTRLVRRVALSLDAGTLAIAVNAVAAGYASGATTAEIIRSIERDAGQLAARAIR